MVRKSGLKRIPSGLASLVLLLGIVVQAFFPGAAFAAGSFTSLSLTLSPGSTSSFLNGSSIPDGGSYPGASANYALSFNIPDTTSVDAIEFQFCAQELIPSAGITTCNAPTGMNTSTVASTPSVDDGTAWTVNTADSTAADSASSNNAIVLTGTGTALVGSVGGTANFTLDNITNPTTANQTFYVYITTYAGAWSTSATPTDSGSTAASTANKIELQGTMPETLVFCTGQTIDVNASNVPDCTTAKFANSPTDTIPFNQLFDPNETAWATSQMAAATNAGSGYAITVDGPTLSTGACAVGNTGGDCIDPMSANPDISRVDTRQFGMNLIDDSTPTNIEPDGATPIAADPTIGPTSLNKISYYSADNCKIGGVTPCGGNMYPVSDGNNYTGVQNAKFNGWWPDGADNTGDTSNYPTYYFVANTPTLVATSGWENTGGYTHAKATGGPTDTQRYTTTYIANVSGNQPAGTYTTTLTYICTPTF